MEAGPALLPRCLAPPPHPELRGRPHKQDQRGLWVQDGWPPPPVCALRSIPVTQERATWLVYQRAGSPVWGRRVWVMDAFSISRKPRRGPTLIADGPGADGDSGSGLWVLMGALGPATLGELFDNLLSVEDASRLYSGETLLHVRSWLCCVQPQKAGGGLRVPPRGHWAVTRWIACGTASASAALSHVDVHHIIPLAWSLNKCKTMRHIVNHVYEASGQDGWSLGQILLIYRLFQHTE